MFVSVLGDLDGDGTPDIYATDFPNSASGPATGRAYVYSGKTGKNLRTLTGRDGRVLQTFTGEVPGETLGFDAVGVGDVDGDGATDYLISSAWGMVNGLRSGPTYIFAGCGRGARPAPGRACS